MSHPQRQELRDGLEGMLRLPENAFALRAEELLPFVETGLTVYAPGAGAKVSFYGNVDIHPTEDRLVRTANLQFAWPGDGDRERAIARRLGLPEPEWTTVRRYRVDLTRRYDPKDVRKRTRAFDEVRSPPFAVCDVNDADQGADLALAVLRDVFGVSEAHWLWITHLPDDRDRWPVPTPRPDQWPPGAAWPPGG